MKRMFIPFVVVALAGTRSPTAAQEFRLTQVVEAPVEDDTTTARRLRELATRTDPASLAEAARLASELRAQQLENACRALFVSDTAKKSSPSVWAMSTRRAACVWGAEGITGLDQATVTAGDQTGAIYTDLVTTYFGPFRANVGTMVSSTGSAGENDDDDDNDVIDAREAIQRLVAGGGNVVLGVQLPVLRWYAPSANGFDFVIAGLGRGATDVEALGAEPTSANTSFALALDGRVRIMSNDKQLQLFGYGKVEGIWGGESLFPAFEEEPTTTQTIDGPKNFQYGRVSIGAFLWNIVRVTYTTYPWCNACGDTGLSGQATVTLQRQLGPN
ncbi:MAG TPA: hypothetical protein VGC13_15275 [Longimicrobium sp.]|jgi:hypothetical protein|uniref:hypothetical protein n=1 Tax=Longimicrobium sp. TaxID=2029185 RepID=UPI002ED8CA69